MITDRYFDLAAEHFGYVPPSEIAKTDKEVLALADFMREKFVAFADEVGALAVDQIRYSEANDKLRAENATLRDAVESVAFLGVTHPHLFNPKLAAAVKLLHPDA